MGGAFTRGRRGNRGAGRRYDIRIYIYIYIYIYI